ncbi:hypothetical protein HaLaN_17789 [Haematococcus lacustris]|uniref:Uncharacterized protein n=1 Tax=Haematococcus lacustris TaxID=44745 RepID=A0A699ZD72_HAELA|nr:hypothetical protein HaLaN_17789 [Haematococcus lacustris]
MSRSRHTASSDDFQESGSGCPWHAPPAIMGPIDVLGKAVYDDGLHRLIWQPIGCLADKAARLADAKRTKAEQAAEPSQPTKAEQAAEQGQGCKAKPASQPGRWLDRDCNVALNMQRIWESRWRSLELCWWPEQGALPAKGKEYPGLGYKRVRDKPAAAACCGTEVCAPLC